MSEVAEAGQTYGCIHCGAPVPRPGYACGPCAEEQLPFELQKREDDHFLLIRKRGIKAGKRKGEEDWIILRPKNQAEGNAAEVGEQLAATAQHLRRYFSFAKSAEGKEFWLGLVNMLDEKAAEMLAPKKK